MNALTKQIEGLTTTMKTFEDKNFNVTSRLDEYEQRLDTYAISFNQRLIKIEDKEAAHELNVSSWKDKVLISLSFFIITYVPFGDKIKPFVLKAFGFFFGFV